MKEMLIRRQSLEEMNEIYHSMLTRHFPADEVKPFGRIKQGYEQGEYVGYGLYESEETKACLAYAWMGRIPSENWFLLDYYAVAEELRGKGLGSRFLRKILDNHTQGASVIIEVEDPDAVRTVSEVDMESEKKKRLRRIEFYLRNGAQETQLRSKVFQVNYSIMVYLNRAASFDRESLERAYHYFYNHVPDNICIWQKV